MELQLKEKARTFMFTSAGLLMLAMGYSIGVQTTQASDDDATLECHVLRADLVDAGKLQAQSLSLMAEGSDLPFATITHDGKEAVLQIQSDIHGVALVAGNTHATIVLGSIEGPGNPMCSIVTDERRSAISLEGSQGRLLLGNSPEPSVVLNDSRGEVKAVLGVNNAGGTIAVWDSLGVLQFIQ